MTSSQLEEKDFKTVLQFDLENPELLKNNSIQRKILENKINTRWSSCCCKETDSRLLKYIGQYITLSTVLIFDLFMLYRARSCEDQTTYISLLTFLLGLAIPVPR